MKAPGKKLWWASVAALGAASALDVQSSWGRRELNPLLRGPDGRFGVRGLQLKSAMVGAACVLEWLVLRRHHGMAKPIAGLNSAMAAWTAAAAVHNHAIARGGPGN